jgi:hypothetical protein
MRRSAIATVLAMLALPGPAFAECATPRIAGHWLLFSDWDHACRISVDAAGAFATTSCRGTVAAYSGRLSAAADCAVDLTFSREDGGRLDTLRGVGRLAIDQSRIDGYYVEPDAGAVGLSMIRELGRD